jgi:hypothetical protein
MMWTLDGEGLIGTLLSYSLTLFIFGSSLLLFLYFYSKGSLSFDDEAAKQMLVKEASDRKQDHGKR